MEDGQRLALRLGHPPLGDDEHVDVARLRIESAEGERSAQVHPAQVIGQGVTEPGEEGFDEGGDGRLGVLQGPVEQ